jgi:hypothetical protein
MYYCKPHNVSQKLLNGTILLSIDSTYDLTDDDNAASTLSTGGRNIPPDVAAKGRNVSVSYVVEYFRNNVIPKLDGARRKIAVLALIDILAEDDLIPGDTEVYLESHRTKNEIITETEFDPAELIANLFLYAVANVKSSDFKSEIKEITIGYIDLLEPKKDSISFRKTVVASVPSINKTIKEKNFAGVFNEVKHTETLGLRNKNELRVFHLNMNNCQFSNRELKKFLLCNIGRYVFSRAELEQFVLDDDVESIGMIALAKLKKYGGTDQITGDALGDIMLYAFLEQVLNAPKIMSKIELTTAASHYGSKSDGIHLLALDDGMGQPYHQLVFGASHIIGNLSQAIDEAMDAVQKIKDDPSAELNVVDSTIFGRVFDNSTSEYMKKLILPSKGGASVIDHAYGVFLGYTLELNASTLSNPQFRVEAVKKMQEDIKAATPYIIEKINDMGMNGYSFYFYILPFNDAPEEKKIIISDILTGGAS